MTLPLLIQNLMFFRWFLKGRATVSLVLWESRAFGEVFRVFGLFVGHSLLWVLDVIFGSFTCKTGFFEVENCTSFYQKPKEFLKPLFDGGKDVKRLE